MRQGTYLNAILTVNAALLAGVLWTQLAGQSAWSSSATAQSTAGGSAVPPGSIGTTNAAEQRQKMIETLRDIKTSIDATKKAVESGKLKVEVTNLDQIKKVEVTNIDKLRADQGEKP